MFGIKGNTESTLGGFAGGALASQAFNMLRKGPPQPKKGGGDGPKGEKGIRINNPNKPNAMDKLTDDAMGLNPAESAAQTATATGVGAAAGAATAQNDTDNERPVSEMSLDEIAAAQEQNGQLEAGQIPTENRQQQNDQPEADQTAIDNTQQQNQNADNTNTNGDNQDEDPFAKIRTKANSREGNLGKAINMRVQNAGGWSGIAKSAGKTGAKLVGKAAMMTTMGALGLGVGIVGGDMSDTLKGLGAGLTAGYATGGRLNSAVGNTYAGNNALGRFGNDVFRGMGPERQRNDYIRSYMSNRENRTRLIQKNPNISKKELDAELKQRAELSYDSGVTDAKKLDRAVKLKKRMDEQNPTGKDNEREEKHGANYDKLVARMQLSEKYSDATFDDDDKIAKKQRRLARDIERSMNERMVGPMNEETTRKMKAKANAEAAETMNDIDYLKNG